MLDHPQTALPWAQRGVGLARPRPETTSMHSSRRHMYRAMLLGTQVWHQQTWQPAGVVSDGTLSLRIVGDSLGMHNAGSVILFLQRQLQNIRTALPLMHARSSCLIEGPKSIILGFRPHGGLQPQGHLHLAPQRSWITSLLAWLPSALASPPSQGLPYRW